MSDRNTLLRSFWIVVLVFAVVHALLYGPTLARATFLNDDWFHLEPFPADRIPHLFTGDWHYGFQQMGGFYRPLPRLIIQACKQVFGLRTPVYLLVAALLHVFNCSLVWLIAWRLSKRLVAAWAAATIFAIYPTHCEAVLQISMFPDLMATCGFLLAFSAYLALRETNDRRYWIIALPGVLLAALSKESWVTLPLVLAWLEFTVRADPNRLLPDRKAWLRLAVFAILGLIYVVFRHAILGGVGGYGLALSLKSVRQTYDAVFQMIVFPFGDIELWSDLINVFTILGATLIVWALMRFPPLLLFSMGWLFLTTLPIITLVPRLNNGGRLVYIVAIGWALFLGELFDSMARPGPAQQTRRALAFMAAAALAGCLIATHVLATADWRQSFDVNGRLIRSMAAVANGKLKNERSFAILDWPRHFGVALSNRPDSVVKAFLQFTDLNEPTVDPLLAPDASTGSVTFTVTKDYRLRIGRVDRVQRWQWMGDRLDEWQPWGNARLIRSDPDGVREYEFDDRLAGLVSPDLAGLTGYYSVMAHFQPSRRDQGYVMWCGGGESFDAPRVASLMEIPRFNDQAELANPGWAAAVNRILFLPDVHQKRVTIRGIDVARFSIRPLEN